MIDAPAPESMSEPRAPLPVLLVAEDGALHDALAEALASIGLPAIHVRHATHALLWLEERETCALVVDGTDEAHDGERLIAALRADPRFGTLPVVMLVEDDDAHIARAQALGADDFVRWPARPSEVAARVHQGLRAREYLDERERRERGARVVLELTQALSSTLDLRGILFTVVARIAEVARVDRCSIVLVGEDGSMGSVVAASDDSDLYDLPIDIAHYPEIREVLASGEALVIDDATEHPLFRFVSGHTAPPDELATSPRPTSGASVFRSLAILPIMLDRRPMGVIFLRGRRPTTFRDTEMFLVRTLANATAIALRNAHVLQSLRDQSQAAAAARKAAERRLSAVQKYADFFHAQADGLVVVDAAGRIVFSNARASEILCVTAEGLREKRLAEVFDPRASGAVESIYEGFRNNVFPQMVDLPVRRSTETICERCVLQVSFSGALWRENRIVLVSFRDVTVDRATAAELVKTKDFLQRVIQSSADAIISADLRGQVTLYNRAAERIYGYAAEEVVGQIPAEDLYPSGVAKHIMRLIRASDHGGYGRLEGYRTDVLAKGGVTVPVLLSAALILEDGKPVGSVGVFTDLRERLRMERKLFRAQEELRAREQQAFIADLAGATAHELNQPLTSVLGYAEIVLRRLPATSPGRAELEVIVAEALRMAEIVRKIGTITRYETKSYVGAATIVDLDRSTESPDKGGAHKRSSSSKPPASDPDVAPPTSPPRS